MHSGELLHNLHCPEGDQCLSGNTTLIHSTRTSSYPNSPLYDSYPGEEKVLFHGTFERSLESIEKNGFNVEWCDESSLGTGLYMSPCLRLSKAFTGGIKGAVFVCKVKLGKTKNIEDRSEFTSNEIAEGVNTIIYRGGLEYIIYDTTRIKIIGVIHLKETWE